ncbi:MAG: DMT family transporter [Rhodospirillales bacterium]|nr:DMT family transporter [Rhodospirillales bacterium]
MDRPKSAPPSTEAWLLLFALSLPWGGSFVFFRLLAGSLPALTTVWSRVALATPVLLLLLHLRGGWTRGPAWKDQARDIAVMAVLNNVVPFTLLAWGETRVTAGLASVLNATTPAFGVLVAALFGAEALSRGRLLGCALAFGGVVTLIGPSVLAGGDALGGLACLGAACSYGFAALWGRRLRGVPPLAAAAGQCLASTLLLLPVMALVDRPWALPMPDPGTWGAILGLAWVSTAFAYVIFFRIVVIAGPQNAMLVTFLTPVTGLLLGALFLGETVAPRMFAGLLLIAAGLAAIDGRLAARRLRPAR